MSQATIGIFAEIQIRLDRLRAQAQQAGQTLRTELTQATRGLGVTVPVNVDVPNDLAQRLNARLAALRINPITIPVQFGMPGNVPGAGGMMQGAASPNFGMYVQQIVNAINARGGGGGGGGGAGRGGQGFRNPLSAYGLSRLLGSGIAAYGALEALNIGTGFANAYDTAEHPERVLRGMDHLGARHGAYGDRFMETQAGQIAGIDSRQEALHTIESVPVAGALVRFIDAINGTSRALDDMKKNAEGVAEVHEYTLRQQDQNKTDAAALTHDPLAILDARQDAAKESEASALKTARERVKEAEQAGPSGHWWQAHSTNMADEPAVKQARKALGDLTVTQQQSEKIRDEERKQAEANEAARHGLSGVDVAYAGSMADATDAQLSGDTRGALVRRHAADTDRLRGSYNAKLSAGNLSDKQRADLTAERDAQLREQLAKQALELDNFDRQRERAAEDSAARINEIEKTSDEQMLRARGEAYNASIQAAKNATDRRVGELEREAKAERDTVKKEQLEREAAAEREAGKQREQAIQIEHERETTRQTIASKDAYDEAGLEAGGAHRAARDKKVEDDYQARVRRINESNDPDKDKQLANAKRDRDRQVMLNQHQDQLSDRSLIIDTADASARALGQNHVGEVLSMKAHFEDMERDAKDDPKRLALVKAYEKSQIAATRRSLRPQSQTFGIEQFHDALQQSIVSGARNDFALKALNDLSGNIGAAAKGGGGDPSQSIAKSAKDLSDAANVIKNARNLGIFRRN